MMTITELQFADDAVLVGASRDEMERAARIQDEVHGIRVGPDHQSP